MVGLQNRSLVRGLLPVLVAAGMACTDAGTPRPDGDAAEPPTSRQQRSVVLIVLDTVRADVLSCYGNPRPTTPNIDAFAADGIRFDHAYAPAFWTLPSHASLLTGLYPSEAGATSETNHLPESVTTIAERFRDAGWRTGAVVRNAWISGERGFSQGFDHWVEAWRGSAGVSDAEGEHQAAATAVAWLREVGGEQQPFFLFVNLNIAHMPYDPPEAERQGFLRNPPPSKRLLQLTELSGGWGHLAGALELDDQDYATLRDLYESEVHLADRLVGRLLDTLGELGLDDDTVVVLTSDHGENLGDHGMIDHVYSMYDTTTRVPLIVRAPGIDAHSVDRELASLRDVTPTILAAAAAGGPADHETSLLRPQRKPEPAVFAENDRPVHGIRLLSRQFPGFQASTIDHPIRMIRTPRHKLIWNVGVSAELYDLENDTGELVDLAASSTALRDELLLALRRWHGELRIRTAPDFSSRDSESLQRLRALGYVE